MKIKLVLPRTP